MIWEIQIMKKKKKKLQDLPKRKLIIKNQRNILRNDVTKFGNRSNLREMNVSVNI